MIMDQITYERLNSNDLSSEFKNLAVVSVKLSKKRANIALRFITSMKKLMGEDTEELSIIKSLLVAISQIIILIRMVFFHPRLFQIFIFYFNNQPSYETQISGEYINISFLKK